MPNKPVILTRFGQWARISYLSAGFIAIASSLALLFLLSRTNYLLFHVLIELFSIVVAASIFTVAWHSRRFQDNGFVVFIGISFLFVGLLDLTHTLAYSGMRLVPQADDPNMATQLWLAARFTQSISVLVAPMFLSKKKFNGRGLLLALGLAYAAVNVSIFVVPVFPVSYVEGSGLTGFKILSEYIISLFFAGAAVILALNRKELDRSVFGLLLSSIVIMIASELSFTFYDNPFGAANITGHFFKVTAFALVYLAVVAKGLNEPYATLFKRISESEGKYRRLFSNLSHGYALHRIVTDGSGKPVDYVFIEINPAFEKLTGLKRDKTVGRRVSEIIPGIRQDDADWIGRYGRIALNGKTETFEQYSESLGRWFSVTAYQPEPGYFATVFEDITERKRTGEKIAHLASFPEFNISPIIELDAAGRISYANPAARQAFPQISDESEFGPFLSAAQIDEAKSQPSGIKCDISSQGRHYEQLIIYMPALDRTRVYNYDITKRKQAEEALKESEENYRRIVETAEEGIWVAQTDGKTLFVNQRMAQMLGYRPDEMAGRIGSDFLDESFKASVPELRERLIKGGKIEKELKFRCRDGSVLWTIVNVSPLYDRSGAHIGNLSMHTDITARKQAEKDLARAEERYRTVADYTYNWETWIRADGGYEYISPACARITGYSADEFLNDPSLSERIVHRDDRHIWQSHFGGQEKGRTASAGQQIEFRIIRRDGEARWIQHVCVAVVDDKGRFLGYRGSNRDITENKADEARIIRYNQEITRQAKALRAANAEMEAFSYSVSHDLRAPLRSIDGFSQALLEDGGLPPDSTARDYLSRIRKATRNMSELIDALLRLSRMDNRETALETVDLSGLAGGLWEKLKAAYPGRRIEFSVQPGLAVRADRQLIEIALYNILDNACKFTAEREPATIELGSVPAGPERVFHVRDNGIGFEPAAAEDIFIPFQRAHQDGRFGGSGIGLSIVRRAIRRHHGRVWAESRPGVGTTVFFTLPDGTGSGTA